jgi:hypothetical protein
LQKAGTDRRSFEAHRSLTYQEAASSIDHEKEGLGHIANNEKRSLTEGGLIEVSVISKAVCQQISWLA